MLTAAQVDEVAEELLVARRAGAETAPPSAGHPGFSMDDAYAVARRVCEERLAAGARVVGAKLGFTNRSMWEALGIDRPFWAPVYDDTVTGARTLSVAGLLSPHIEPEIVLGLGATIGPGGSPAEVEAAVSWAALGFEIVQCRYPGWAMAPADALADAGLHAGLVIGDRVPLAGGDLAALAEVAVELRRGDVVVSRGRGEEALGGPADALAWLLRLPGIEPLPAGAVITTGTLTAPAPLSPGETWRLTASGAVALGPLELVLAA